jgi:gamma-glutamylputrescine oxidase
MHDTKRNIFWDRPTPDDKRLLFGARTGARYPDARASARKLHALMRGVYPQLADVKLSNAWQGVMGFTFDRIPHIGRTPEGAWFGLVCNAQGLPIGTYLGQRLAAQMLGAESRPSVFWNRETPTWPFYGGDPWFLPAVVASYDVQDRLSELRDRRSHASAAA